MRILVVEDDHKIANAIARGLRQQTYAVDIAYNGDDGLSMATTEPYDLLILDRMLPGRHDGIGILTEVRRLGMQLPVLLLTAKDKVLDKAFGLNSGADDYLVKPFAFVELIARVRALLRRPQQTADEQLSCADVELDTANHTVKRAGTLVHLSAKEYALLEYLMRHEGETVNKDAIIAHVWDYDADVLPNTVEVYIGYLRRKIDTAFPKSVPLIQTRRGFGYVFGEAN